MTDTPYMQQLNKAILSYFHEHEPRRADAARYALTSAIFPIIADMCGSSNQDGFAAGLASRPADYPDKAEVGRITIARRITDEEGPGADIIHVETEGDAKHALTALGMLAMAGASVLHLPHDEGLDDD